VEAASIVEAFEEAEETDQAACRVAKDFSSVISALMLPKTLPVGALSQQSPFRFMWQSTP